MTTPKPTVFVTGATGCQGGNLARLLLSLNWTVHATVRNPDSPAAKALSSQGAKLTPGDWDNEEALKQSIAGSTLLFLNFYPDLSDWTRELKWTQSILSIAKASGVRHVVYSSVLDTSPVGANVPSQQTKLQVEEAVRTFGFERWTVLRPGVFMNNFLVPNVGMYPGAVDTGVFRLGTVPDARFPLIDPRDIAKFALAAFEDPARFSGHTVNVAGELRSVESCLRLVGQASGCDIRAKYLTEEEMEAEKDNPFYAGHRLYALLEKVVDVDEVKSWGVEMTSFPEFLEREKDWVRDTYANCEAKA